MKGIVTDIQRFSLKDGPGIRTTVFLQGCNMACAWCHNPETISRRPKLMYYENNCIRCGKCLDVCPAGALSIRENEIAIDRTKCLGCGTCAGICFPGALVLSGKTMDSEQVLKQILEDQAYYQNSGGGVTLSGGEVLMQLEFARELLSRCKEAGISTAIESNMNTEWSTVEALLPVVDIVMCDIKLMEEEAHKKWTGVSNRRILENIQNLAQRKIPMIVRTPVIPGVNRSEEAIGAIADHLSRLQGNLMYYELLNFNPLGDAKYKGLEQENRFYGEKPAQKDEMERLAQRARASGIAVRIG